EPPDGFWELPPYFMANHRVLMDHAREAGLGVLSYDEQAENWRVAMARVRTIVQRWGIAFPAIPELDIEGVDVAADIHPEDITPVFCPRAWRSVRVFACSGGHTPVVFIYDRDSAGVRGPARRRAPRRGAFRPDADRDDHALHREPSTRHRRGGPPRHLPGRRHAQRRPGHQRHYR